MLAAGLTLVVATMIAVVLHVSGMALCGLMLGAQIKKVSLFFGPSLASIEVRGVRMELGALPLGGYVSFQEGSIEALHPLRRIAIALAGCALLLLVGFLLGASPVSLVTAPAQFVRGGLHPLRVGAPLLEQTLSRVLGDPLTVMGELAVKFAALNLMPVSPVLNGGFVVRTLAGWLLPGLAAIGWIGRWANVLSLPILLGGMGSWLVALAVACAR